MEKKDFILASASPQRIALLEQVNLCPKMIIPADIDESNFPHETPTIYVKRMALMKAKRVAELYPNENILASDTSVVVGRKILHKAADAKEQAEIMRLISGKSNRVISAVCLIDKNGKIKERCVTSRVITKKLSEEEIKNYVATNEWRGCSGYKIEGCYAGMVRKIIGSYTGIVGLPLYETQNLLNGIGIK